MQHFWQLSTPLSEQRTQPIRPGSPALTGFRPQPARAGEPRKAWPHAHTSAEPQPEPGDHKAAPCTTPLQGRWVEGETAHRWHSPCSPGSCPGPTASARCRSPGSSAARTCSGARRTARSGLRAASDASVSAKLARMLPAPAASCQLPPQRQSAPQRSHQRPCGQSRQQPSQRAPASSRVRPSVGCCRCHAPGGDTPPPGGPRPWRHRQTLGACSYCSPHGNQETLRQDCDATVPAS